MDEEYLKEDYTRLDAEPEPEASSELFQLMYCGPNIPSRGLFSYQVFLGGFPFNVKELISQVPEIEKLMVKMEDVDEVRRKVRDGSSLEYRYYERIRGKVR